ncbi:unnamed protein product [Sphagnum compactum]
MGFEGDADLHFAFVSRDVGIDVLLRDQAELNSVLLGKLLRLAVRAASSHCLLEDMLSSPPEPGKMLYLTLNPSDPDVDDLQNDFHLRPVVCFVQVIPWRRAAKVGVRRSFAVVQLDALLQGVVIKPKRCSVCIDDHTAAGSGSRHGGFCPIFS